MTDAGGIGLAKFLFAQLSGQYSSHPRPVSPFAEERSGVAVTPSADVDNEEHKTE
jgi:Rod binding domain-containing protein